MMEKREIDQTAWEATVFILDQAREGEMTGPEARGRLLHIARTVDEVRAWHSHTKTQSHEGMRPAEAFVKAFVAMALVVAGLVMARGARAEGPPAGWEIISRAENGVVLGAPGYVVSVFRAPESFGLQEELIGQVIELAEMYRVYVPEGDTFIGYGELDTAERQAWLGVRSPGGAGVWSYALTPGPTLTPQPPLPGGEGEVWGVYVVHVGAETVNFQDVAVASEVAEWISR